MKNFAGFFLLVFFCSGVLLVHASHHEGGECQEKDKLYDIYHICGMSCSMESQLCSDLNNTCVCDFRCGTSCINLNNTIDCKLPEKPENGYYWVTSEPINNFGQALYFGCDDGFTLIGNSEMYCMSSGEWSVSFYPVCHDDYDDGTMCQLSPSVDHAAVSTPYNYMEWAAIGSTVMYICAEGYTMYGSALLFCFPNGNWSMVEFSCVAQSCETLDQIQDGYQIGVSYAIGNTIEFRCNPGFDLLGATSITCQGDLSWSDAVPICNLTYCYTQDLHFYGDMHLFVEMNVPVAAGSVTNFSCDYGFQLYGDTTCLCTPDLTWKCDIPGCYKVICDLLHTQPGVRITRTNNLPLESPFYFDDVISFSCVDDTKQLLGVTQSVCSWDNKFTDEMPVCSEDCPEIYETPEHAFRIDSENHLQHNGEVVFYCEQNYKLIGRSRFICKQGAWYDAGRDMKLPSCEYAAKGSSYPIIVLGHTVESDVITVAENTPLLELNCKIREEAFPSWIKDFTQLPRPQTFVKATGWYRLRLRHLKISMTGTYSCIASDETLSSIYLRVRGLCSDPGTLPHAIRALFDTVLHTGVFASYECETGYRMVGNSVIGCQENNEWSASPPICIRETCENTIPNVKKSYIKIEYHSDDKMEATLGVFCNLGYRLQPLDMSTMECKNAKWIGSPPSCVHNKETIEFSFVTGDSLGTPNLSFKEGEQVFINCRMPEHEEHGMGPLWTPANYSQWMDAVTESTTNHSSQMTLVFPYITHEQGGRWSCGMPGGSTSESLFISVRRKCSVPPDIAHSIMLSYYDLDDLYEGCNVSLQCVDGFVLHGDSMVVCDKNGWLSHFPSCVPDVGLQLISSERNKLMYEGEQLTLLCIVDSFPGNSFQTLFDDGFVGWSWEGAVELGSGKFFQEVLVGTCIKLIVPFLSLHHTGTFSCGTRSSKVSQHITVARLCSNLPSPNHGQILDWSRETHTLIRYQCEDRYILVGPATRRCQLDGTWTESEPECIVSECKHIQNFEHGSMILAEQIFGIGAEIELYCDVGYNLTFDSGGRTCLLDGSWSQSIPSCISLCLNYTCGLGEKCVLIGDRPTCICKSEADCVNEPMLPVCGSNAFTYDKLCQLEVASCVLYYSTVYIVHDGTCVIGGQCQATTAHVSQVAHMGTSCGSNNEFFFDKNAQACMRAPAGFCMPIGTGFMNELLCVRQCIAEDFCVLPKSNGLCNLNQPKWYYDQGSCIKFNYGGCQGNENNFNSVEDCYDTCPDRCQSCPRNVKLAQACNSSVAMFIAKVDVLFRFTHSTYFSFDIIHSATSSASGFSKFDSPSVIGDLVYYNNPCLCPNLKKHVTYLIIATELEDGDTLYLDDRTFVERWTQELEDEFQKTCTCIQHDWL